MMVDPGFASGLVAWVSPLLFGLGLAAVFARRSSLAMLIGLQWMFAAAALAFVGFDLRGVAAAPDAAPGGSAIVVTTALFAAAQSVFAIALFVARARIASRKGNPISW